MKKRAFTLLELIFVIVIIGILSGIGFYSFKPHYLRNDINFVFMKLEDTRYKAMGYDKTLPNLSSDYNESIGCIRIDELNVTNDTKNNTDAYKFRSQYVSVSPTDINTLCFDIFGRVHKNDDNTTLNSLIFQDVNITYRYNNEQKSMIIDHLSGNIRIF